MDVLIIIYAITYVLGVVLMIRTKCFNIGESLIFPLFIIPSLLLIIVFITGTYDQVFPDYRILEVDGEFIPQKRKYFTYYGIGYDCLLYENMLDQIEFCSCLSKDSANDTIIKYKNYEAKKSTTNNRS